MHIALSTLKNTPGETLHFAFSLDAAELDLNDEEFKFTEPLEFGLDAVYRDGQYILEGSLRTKVVLSCSRCLKSFISPLKGEMADEILANEATELAVSELVLEMIYANLPLKPLCDAACKGLCTVCGENLNEKQCGCDTDEVDHRLSVLKKLLEE